MGNGAGLRRGMRILAVLAAAALLAAAPQPARPVIAGIAHVAIQTSDLTRARAFYGGLLGYAEAAPKRPHTAIFIVNDRQRLIVRDGLPPSRDERFIDLAFEADVNPMRDWLAGHGMPASEAAADAEAGGRRIESTRPRRSPGVVRRTESSRPRRGRGARPAPVETDSPCRLDDQGRPGRGPLL